MIHVLLQFRALNVEKGQSCFVMKNINPTDVNSVITKYYQHGAATLYEDTINDLVAVSSVWFL